MKWAVLIGLICAGCSHSQALAPDASCLSTGTFHAQVLANGDGVQDRVYWLHVPANYQCGVPTPLLVDFHGTAGDVPEEAYQTDAITAFSDVNGVIVARPRSLSVVEGGYNIYTWDAHPGDVALNIQFADNLVRSLSATYSIDPARLYASGFSSGSDMTVQFLSDPNSPFKGIAPIAGGLGPEVLPALPVDMRIYMATGYRDYLWTTARILIAKLATALPADQLFVRHSGGGHDLYPWHFDDLWQFLDAKIRPIDGPIDPAWTVSSLPMASDINELADDGGTLVAAGAGSRTWRSGATGWTRDLNGSSDADFAALCFGSGRALVGGDDAAAFGSGTTWAASAGLPDFGGMIGEGWVNRAVCRPDGSIVVAGLWSSAIAQTGTTWSQFSAPYADGTDAELAGIATSSGGATIVVGYPDYIGRAAGAATAAAMVAHPAVGDWWNGVAAVDGGLFWAVGDGGGILASSDDGQTWTAQTSGTTENLYAVHFADAQHGAAVGLHGTVVTTIDGGAHWTTRPIGIEGYLGAVWADATTITIAGERGFVATTAW